MYCSNCGHKAPENTKYCSECGCLLKTAGLENNERYAKEKTISPEVFDNNSRRSPGSETVDIFDTSFQFLIGIVTILTATVFLFQAILLKKTIPFVSETQYLYANTAFSCMTLLLAGIFTLFVCKRKFTIFSLLPAIFCIYSTGYFLLTPEIVAKTAFWGIISGFLGIYFFFCAIQKAGWFLNRK